MISHQMKWKCMFRFVCALLEAAAFPSVFTLGKEPFALGKGFAQCSTRQSPLGKIFLGKGSLPSAFYRGTRQSNILPSAALGKIKHSAKVALPSARHSVNPGCRQNWARHSAKGGRPVTAATCRQILPSA